MSDPVFVEVRGEKHAVIIPDDFAMCEELCVAHLNAGEVGGVTQLRAYSAMLGLCTRLGRRAGVSYAAEGHAPLVYGGKVYGWLRKGGADVTARPTDPPRPKATIAEIVIAGKVVYPILLIATFPREEEVGDALGKSEASADA